MAESIPDATGFSGSDITVDQLLVEQLEALEDKAGNREVCGDGWTLEASAYRAGLYALREATNPHEIAARAYRDSARNVAEHETPRPGRC